MKDKRNKILIFSVIGVPILIFGLMFVVACTQVIADWYASPQRTHMMSEIEKGKREQRWYHYFL